MFVNKTYPFHSDSQLNGLGKKFWKRVTVKNVAKAANPIILHKKLVVEPFRRSKTLRKAALIAGTGAALYFAAPLVASKLGIGAAGKLAAGAAATKIASGATPGPADDGSSFISQAGDFIDTAYGASASSASPSQRMMTQPAQTDFLNTKNMVVIGAGAAVLLGAFLLTRKG